MALNPGKIQLGPGRIYVGVTLPTTETPLALTSGAPATGTEVGVTEGETLFTYEVEYLEEGCEQILPAVAVFAKGQTASLEFGMKEYAAANLQAAMQQVKLTANEGASPKYDLLTFGGPDAAVVCTSVVVVSAIPNTTPQRHTLAMLYSAYQSEPMKARYTAKGSTVLKATFKAIAVASRNPMDYLGQVVIYRN